MKKIAIIGYGHVGQAMHKIFPEAIIYDPLVKGYEKARNKQECNRADLGIICVPTPGKKNGSCDISIVEEVVKWLKMPLILIKSTVAVGTTDRLKKKYKKRICTSPEYYGESKYWTPDFWSVLEWPFLIVGGDPKDTQEIVDIFMPVLGPLKSYWQTDAKTAEFVKYMDSVWGAMKVVWANEMALAAERLRISYEKARELWVLDPRVERAHTAVFKENRGFGGKCFPKDLSAFIRTCEKAGFNPKLLKQIKERNKYFRGLRKKD